jgi:UDP:flavonoid glycosyltransferase YjiC (YdhE family)
MRILIPLFSPPTGTWGGLTRVLALSAAAREAGHQVAFCASGTLAQNLLARGYPVYETPALTMFGLPRSISSQIEKRSQSMHIPVRPGKEVGNFWFVLALSGLANTEYLKKLVNAQLQAVAKFKPDRLFTDADPGAYLTAAITDLPAAGNYASIMQKGIGSPPYHWLEKAANSVLAEHGQKNLSLESLYFGKQILKISPSIPALDDTPPDQPDVLFVGSLLGEIQSTQQSSEFDDSRRYVFAYLGTGSLSLETAKKVLPLIFPKSGSLRCLVGAQSITQPLVIEGVEFRPYIPAEAILPHCDWTLCHGGQNTIIQSLRQGVPLLLFPGPIFERRYNARKVIQAGAGYMGEVNQFTPTWFEPAFFQKDLAAKNARILAEQIQNYGGAQAAIAALKK